MSPSPFNFTLKSTAAPQYIEENWKYVDYATRIIFASISTLHLAFIFILEESMDSH